MRNYIHKFRRAGTTAFTLVEMMVALAIFGAIATAVFICFEALQRGNAFMSNWADVRAAQIRLFDSLARDLQNSISYSGSNGTLPLINNTFPIVLQIPRGYSNYFTSGARAGDPDMTLSTSGTISPLVAVSGTSLVSVITGASVATVGATTGHLYYSGTLTVTYSSSTSGSSVTINRTASWPAGSAVLTDGSTATWTSGTGTRSIATFSNGVTVTFTNTGGTALTGSSTETAVLTTITATADQQFLNRTTTITPSLTDTVFLRAKSIQ